MCWPYYPRLRKERDAEGKPKEGQPVTVEQITSPKLIAKEFSDICTEARNLRFDKKRRLEFEKLATASSLESFDLVKQRKTGLVLVENCTAWLYLHRRDGACGTCKSVVSRLLKRLRLIESEINEISPSAIFLQNAADLRKDIDAVLHTFRQKIGKLKE
ncbi:hypothetical protein TELCIR_02583 [Teladorsagia circumcincta]|uniref:Uncharacterized protein n=1 Tax=Teladorsagia circumcincta TaxID=45464 RepID=A0A2G9UYU2_TELCI|nr:hypothetical protein TELCIR_02583 [Teladorsagia circumcincta]